MKKLFLIFSVCVFMASCNKSEPLLQEPNDIFGFTTVAEARQHLGKYADIFSPTNGSMYIRSTSFGSNEGEQGEIFGRYRENSNQQPSNGGQYSFGDIKLLYDDVSKTYIPESGLLSNDEKVNQISNLFGTNSSFTLHRNGTKILEFSQYVPEKISVDITDAVDHQGSNLKAINRNNFEITWNKDDLNTNGIVAYLWWNGDRTDLPANQQGQGEVINKAVKLDDTGSGIISKDIFGGIPANAIVTVFFIRGNVDIRETQSESFKFYSVTQDKHNLILLD